MEGPAVAQVDDALEELVNQFSDPFSFLRELVQNAIDAGSHEIEIGTHYEPKDPGGTAVIEVSDWGGGMTREVIETKLTRLFSSQKDGDRTKIGKFGIGFVSVFAIEPDVVCVDTARDGEAWRVLFDASRSFRLVRLDEPIEGTTIRIYKSMPQADFEAFSASVKRTVVFWCKHASCEIRVDGEPIAVPFAYAEPCSVEHDDGYSRIAACHPVDRRTFFGLYNGGLTLKEQRESPYRSVAVRAWSPHLEHTLTRDAVIVDAGYERVSKTVKSTVDGPLAQRCFEALETELRARVPTPLREYYHRCVGWHLGRGLSRDTRSAVAQRAVAMRPSGEPLTFEGLVDGVKSDVLFVTRARGPLSDAVEAAGYSVAHGAVGYCEGRVLDRVGALGGFEVKPLAQMWVLPLPLTESDAPMQPLAEAATAVFREAGQKVSEVVFGHFDYPGSSLEGEVAISLKDPFSLSSREDIKTIGSGFFSRSRPVVVNADHATVKALVALSAKDLSLAAYMLTKLFFVGAGLTSALDGELAAAASQLEAR